MGAEQHEDVRTRLVRLLGEVEDPAGEGPAVWPAQPDRPTGREGDRPALRVVPVVPGAGAGTVREGAARDSDPVDEGAAGPGDAGASLGDLRRRAVASAVRGYTAAHGHPLDHPDLMAPAGVRWSVSMRVAVAAAVALALPVAAVLVRTVADRPVTVVETVQRGGAGAAAGTSDEPDGTVPAGGAAPGTAAPAAGADGGGPQALTSGTAAGADAGTVVVHVVGQVVRPGVQTLPAGARVADAVAAAGGTTADADLTALNLARVLVDGEQVRVPRPGEVVGPAPGGGPVGAASPATAGGSSAVPGPLDLNTAQVADLDALPGIGPVLAQRIVDWRADHGRFTSVDELGEVTGIGPSLLGDLRGLVGV